MASVKIAVHVIPGTIIRLNQLCNNTKKSRWRQKVIACASDFLFLRRTKADTDILVEITEQFGKIRPFFHNRKKSLF